MKNISTLLQANSMSTNTTPAAPRRPAEVDIPDDAITGCTSGDSAENTATAGRTSGADIRRLIIDEQNDPGTPTKFDIFRTAEIDQAAATIAAELKRRGVRRASKSMAYRMGIRCLLKALDLPGSTSGDNRDNS